MVCCLPETASAADKGKLSREQILSAQNPVPDFNQLTISDTFNTDTGPSSRNAHLLEIQFSTPINVDQDWKVVTNTRLAALSLPAMTEGGSRHNEFGDVEFTVYLQPRQARRFVWRFGPSIRMPAATSDFSGSGKWSIGPAFAAVDIGNRFVYGIVGNMLWSVTGESDRDAYSVLTLRPFVNYNLENGWYLVSAAPIVANWEASSNNRWTIPIGGGVGRVFRLGNQTVNVNIQAFEFLDKVEGDPDRVFRFQLQLPFFDD